MKRKFIKFFAFALICGFSIAENFASGNLCRDCVLRSYNPDNTWYPEPDGECWAGGKLCDILYTCQPNGIIDCTSLYCFTGLPPGTICTKVVQ
jgi:hypothetical protein